MDDVEKVSIVVKEGMKGRKKFVTYCSFNSIPFATAAKCSALALPPLATLP